MKSQGETKMRVSILQIPATPKSLVNATSHQVAAARVVIFKNDYERYGQNSKVLMVDCLNIFQTILN